MTTNSATNATEATLRRWCRGDLPLTGRLEDWMLDVLDDRSRLDAALDEFGSPVNVLHTGPMERNVAELVAAAPGVDLKIFFARKANKALCFVDTAARLGVGVDVASRRELSQTLDAGVPPEDVIISAAVKSRGLLEDSIRSRVLVALDNRDEAVELIAAAGPGRHPVAVRLAPRLAGGKVSRFGATSTEWLAWLASPELRSAEVHGVHFHLDGYDPAQRAEVMVDAVRLVDALRERGHPVRFVDMGGGLPVRYLDDAAEWEAWWTRHRAAVVGQSEPLTYDNEGLGLVPAGDAVAGTAKVYPFAQAMTRGPWMESVLDARPAGMSGGESVRAALTSRGLQLRCEPGRALMDGCGLSVARVEFVKQRSDGVVVAGLGMNRTQCRTSTEEFMVDPLLVPIGRRSSSDPGSNAGFLVGAYCMERELISWRRMVFPSGITRGDLVVFPNTAGYLMHFLESTSHQIPLAANLVWEASSLSRDRIDATWEWNRPTPPQSTRP